MPKNYPSVRYKELDDVRFRVCIRCRKNRSQEGLCQGCKPRRMMTNLGREPCIHEDCKGVRMEGYDVCRRHNMFGGLQRNRTRA